MGEVPQINPQEIGLLHEEALTIDNEVGKRRASESNSETTNSELAALSITLRSERLSKVMDNNPEVRDHILRNYVFELSSNGIEVYLDPKITDDTEEAKPCLEYFQSPKFPEDLSKFKAVLPAFYKQSDQVPAVYIHSKETAAMLDQGGSAGFVYRGHDIIKNIHLVSGGSGYNPKFVFYHEYSHALEGGGTNLELFKEGIANMVADRVLGFDSHKVFLEIYSGLDVSGTHPIVGSLSEGSFHFRLRDLLEPNAMSPNESDNRYSSAAQCTKYDFVASFLSWYQDNYDKELTVVNQNVQTTPNYLRIFTRIHASFPAQRAPMSQGTTNQRTFPKIIDTVPEDLMHFGNQLQMIGVPDNDPAVLKLAEQVKDAEPSEVARLCREFNRMSEERLSQVEAEYNKLITSKYQKRED